MVLTLANILTVGFLWGVFKKGWMSFVCLVLKASAEKRCDEVGRVGELKEAQPVREKRR